MRRKIRYVPDGIELDLSEPGLGHENGLEILQLHFRQSERPGMGCSKASPAFVCVTHEGGANPGLYLKKRDGEWWAVHYEAGGCGSHLLPPPMSDEHRRQTEYWARAAQDAGWRVELEHSLLTGTRPDALIHGPVTTGIEVQRSAMTASRAVDRTRKAAGAGVTDVWFSDRPRTPRWSWRVPTVLPRELGIDAGRDDFEWKSLPPRRSVAAAGLRVLRTLKCEPASFGRCPYGRNWCGRYHPRPEPWAGLAVDDVAARVPAGEIVPLRFWGVKMLAGSRYRDAVFLVSPGDFARYEEVTGWSGTVSFRPGGEDGPPQEASGAAECRNAQLPGEPGSSGIWGIDPQTQMWCDACELPHAVVEHRICRAAARN